MEKLCFLVYSALLVLTRTIYAKSDAGLRKDASTTVWRWLSDNSTVNASNKGHWPWAKGQPSDGNNKREENCAQMYRNYSSNFGRYNDVRCNLSLAKAGFICELTSGGEKISAKATASTITGLNDESQASKTTRTKGPSTIATTGVTSGNTVTEHPLADDVHASKPNLVVIVVALLAIFILLLVVAFGLMFFRRRRSHDKQYEDRVICTCEKPSSSEPTSLDPVLVQQTQSSAELTVHLTLSRTESGLATYETVSDCKKECGYDNIETNRKLSSVSEGCSDIQEKAPENTVLVSGEKGIQQPPALCDKKEENKDHVYAVVHKERKGRASSEVSALEKTAGRPQEETSGLTVQWASCVDQSPSLTPESGSSHQTDTGLDNNTEATGSEAPQAGGNTEYLYAAVDMTKKKKKPPQKPAPYRGLVYADLILSRENSAKLVKEQSQTVYAQYDPVKTASVKISQKNAEETKDGEHK